MEPSLKTVKRLFALSRNQCAFPECSVPLVEVSGTVTGVICHIGARSKAGPRYQSNQSNEERHSFSNLLLLCGRHSKVIDSEPNKYTIDKLRQFKQWHEQHLQGTVEISAVETKAAEELLQHYRAIHITAPGNVMLASPGGIQASSVIIKNQKRKINVLPPSDSIASSLSHRNYIKHLIDRYQEFAAKQPDRRFAFPAIYATLQRKYGAKWDMVPLNRFEDLVTFLQMRVDRTMLGSMNRTKGIPNYSTFVEYKQKYGGE